MDNSIVIKVILVVVTVFFAHTLYRGRQMRRARRLGLWPKPGEIPTDEHIRRLVGAGEKMLAIRLCRQIHNMGLADAKAVVEKLAEQSGLTNAAPAD
jgi:hypothetical protein